MKKDKTEKIFTSLSEYLKKRNYECGFSLNLTSYRETSDKETGMIGLLESPSHNSYSFSATSANHFHVDHQFARLKSWMMEASEPCRSELSQLLFPLFVHIFLELSAATNQKAAHSFYNKNYQVFRVNRDYESTLRQLVNSSTGEVNLALLRSLRRGKYQVRLSDSNILNYLLRYLKSSNNPTIVQILHRYIEIEMEDGFVPSNVFSDIESSIKSKSGSAESSSGQDCTAEELAAVESAINGVEGLPHPGLSLALYSVVNAYNGVCNATISPDVDVLACGFEDSVIKIWSLTPHWPHSSVGSNVGHNNSNYCSNKSHTILSCDNARLDDPLKEERKTYMADENTLNSAGNSASSGSRQRKQASGGEIWSLRGHSGPVYDLSFTNNSSHLLSVSEDTYMRLWDLSEGECVAKYSGHNYPVFRVECSPQTVHIATGSYDLSARLWSLEYLHPLRVFAGHTASVSALAFHPNCSYLATGSWDNSVRLWQITDSNAVRILVHHAAPVTSLAFAPHGKQLASGSDDGCVVVWDLATGKVLTELTHLTTCDLPPVGATATPPEGIVQLSWSKDSKLLIVGSIHGIVRTIGLAQSSEDNGSGSSSPSLEGSEVHSVTCSSVSDATLLHASLTQHNYIAAVVAQQPDR